MTILEKLKSFEWISISAIEKVCGIPSRTIQLTKNKAIPEKYIPLIEKEFNRFIMACKDNISSGIKEEIEVAIKKEVIKPYTPDCGKIIDNLQKHIKLDITSEWNEEFSHKIIKLKESIKDNTMIEVVYGNGTRYECYSKGKDIICSSDNLPMKWTYLPKAYLTN